MTSGIPVQRETAWRQTQDGFEVILGVASVPLVELMTGRECILHHHI